MGKYWSKFLLLCMLIFAGVNGAPDTDTHTSWVELKETMSWQTDSDTVPDLVFPPFVEDHYFDPETRDWDWIMTFRVINEEYSFRSCFRKTGKQVYQAECTTKTGISLYDEEDRLWVKFPKAEASEIAQRVTVDRFNVCSANCPGLAVLSEEVTAIKIPVFLSDYLGLGVAWYEFDFPRSPTLHHHFKLVPSVDDPLTNWAIITQKFLVGYRANKQRGMISDYFRVKGEEWTENHQINTEQPFPTEGDISGKHSRTQLLIDAIWKNDLPAIKELIAAGADINCHVGHNRETPLTAAAVNGNQAILDFLLAQGAKIEGRNRNGETALIAAAEAENQAIAIQLIDAGADVNDRNDFGVTALVLAAANGDLELTRNMVDHGADVDSQSIAFCAALDWKHFQVAEYLLSNQVDIHITGTKWDSPFNYAVRSGNLDMVQKILARKPNVNEKWKSNDEYKGYTPLMIAIEHGYVQIARVLIAAGADPHIRNIEKMTALMLAVVDDQKKIMTALLDCSVEVGARDVDGWDALMYAARFGRADLADRLIAAGASVSISDAHGFTPLMIAAWNGHAAVVHRLLAAGADPAAVVRDGVYRGKWALDLARAAGAADIVSLLTAE